tara:strand:- start:5 stop:247 length:243 start_codon:yes stop_codon:yes gene_type:complete
MSFAAFILFGHICIAVPNELDSCRNIYHTPIKRYYSLQACESEALGIIGGAQTYYRKKGLKITELELRCIPVDRVDSATL